MKNNQRNQKTAVSLEEVQRRSSWVYQKFFQKDRYTLKARAISLGSEIQTIHRWANMAYSRKYWQMQGSAEEVFRYYHSRVKSGELALFFICHKENPVAQIEVYSAYPSELANYYEAKPGDHGIHTLLAPYREIMRIMPEGYSNIAVNILKTVQGMLFSFSTVKRIVTEPDATNTNACRLAGKTGFRFVKEIQLPDKRAHLYMITKQEYLAGDGG